MENLFDIQAWRECWSALSELAGTATFLPGSGITMTRSEGIARLLFWLLMLTFLLSSVQTLGLKSVTATIARLIEQVVIR